MMIPQGKFPTSIPFQPFTEQLEVLRRDECLRLFLMLALVQVSQRFAPQRLVGTAQVLGADRGRFQVELGKDSGVMDGSPTEPP